VNAEAKSYYCGIFAADFAVPFYMIFFLFQIVYLYEQSDSRRDRRGLVQMVMPWQVSEIGAKATELAGRAGNSRPFHVSQPPRQIETKKAQEQLQSVGASLWQSEPKCRTTKKCQFVRKAKHGICM
jgi:hypothetical protein